MNIHFTFDYELFFGENVGSVDNCMIKPTNMLIDKLEKVGALATFYVDIGYLNRCQELDCDKKNYTKVVEQIKQLQSIGHDIQLHIHPHWEDSRFESGKWVMDVQRFRLHDFDSEHATDIIQRYSKTFKDITGNNPLAYRAGGWCIQPFEHIADALYKEGVRVDSTVYKNGYNRSSTHFFDFRHSPELNHWTFDNDPLKQDESGRFLELPIADIAVSPIFFWEFVLAKKLGGKMHRNIGDGSAIAMSKSQLLRLLLLPSYSVASIDGYKARLLEKAYRMRVKRLGMEADFVIIGHPKAVTEFSLRKLAGFLEMHSTSDRFITASQWYSEVNE